MREKQLLHLLSPCFPEFIAFIVFPGNSVSSGVSDVFESLLMEGRGVGSFFCLFCFFVFVGGCFVYFVVLFCLFSLFLQSNMIQYLSIQTSLTQSGI